MLLNRVLRGRPFAAIALLAAVAMPTAAAVAQQVADTQFSSKRGLYAAPFSLTISSATPGATIHYTLDCSDPRTSANVAQGATPVTLTIDPASTNGGLRPLTPGVVVRAYATAPGLTETNVDTQTYIFPANVLTQVRPNGFTTAVQFNMDGNVVNDPLYSGRILDDLAAIPTMSVVTDYTSMFGSNGVVRAPSGSIEAPGSIEVMHPDGRDDQAACGLTPHSWQQWKRSVRIYFRAQYGDDKWRHDLFRSSAEGNDAGVKSFDDLVLRAGFNDGLLYGDAARAGRYSFSVDDMARSSQIAMTGFGARGMFVHLYLNGLYWGLYNPVERPEAGHMSEWFGGAKDDWFARNHSGVLDGDATFFNATVSAAAAFNWNTVSQRLDINSFCDYILGWSYCGGGDWPSFNGANNNWYAGNRNTPQNGRVRFFNWDAEDSWINLPNRPGPPTDHARLVNELLVGPLDVSKLWRVAQQQADFRTALADRVYKHCTNDGALTDDNMLERWNRITDVVDHGTVGESARWGRFDPRGVTWKRNNDWVPYVASVRQMFVDNRTDMINSLRNTAVPSPHPVLYPSLEPPQFQLGAFGTAIEISEPWVAPGQVIGIVRSGAFGTIYYTTDGSDPRAPGGAAVGAPGGSGTFVIANGAMRLKARTLIGSEWSAVHELFVQVRQNLPAIEIGELLAENVVGLTDEAGDHDDWIELRNRSAADVDLSGYHLTDDLTDPTKWTIPVGTVVRAGRSVLVWADNEPAEGPLHATFKLSGLGEEVGLFAPGGSPAIDQFVFGDQRDDVSIGRLDCEPGVLVTMPRPTPGRSNRPQPCGHLQYEAQDHTTNPAPLRGRGVPSLGDSLRFELEQQPAGSIALLALGTQVVSVDLPGLGTLLVDPLVFVSGIANVDGEVRFEVPVPDNALVRGAVLIAQGAGDVLGAVQLSNGVVSRVCD